MSRRPVSTRTAAIKSTLERVATISVRHTVHTSDFYHYPDLPIEAKKRFWQHYLIFIQSRFIPIWLKTWRRSPDGAPEDCDLSEQKYLNKVAPPAVLHICHDARAAALEKYSLPFSDPAQRCPVYIDPLIDTVYLSGEPTFDVPLLFTVRNLAFPIISAPVPLPSREHVDARCWILACHEAPTRVR